MSAAPGRRLRVAMLGPFGLHPKGTMRARAVPAARALAARGHTVLVLMPPWHTPDEADRAWVEDGVAMRNVSLAGLAWGYPGHLVVAVRMARAAWEWRPDVIHAFKPKAYAGLAADLVRLASPFGGRPALVVDTDDWEGEGGWNEVEPYPPLMRRFFAWQESFGLRHADGVTVASRALLARVGDLGVPEARIAYLPNAVPERRVAEPAPALPAPAPALQAPAAAAAAASAPALSAVSAADVAGAAAGAGARPRDAILLYTRFVEFDPLRPLRLLALVRRYAPGARLVVAGLGLRGEEATLRNGADEAGLADAVEFWGWIDAERLARLVAESAVAIYPMDDTVLNRTKSPMKLLELMALGAPIVADAVGEAAQWIEHGESGRLVPAGDTDAAAREVAALLDDSGERQRLGRGAVERVRARFTWTTRVEELEAAYLGALARR